jgi:hypothetical protein
MRRLRGAAWGIVAVVSVGACATPSRRLTTRIVEDPMVLPRGLFGLSVQPSVTKYSTRDAAAWDLGLTFRYGITDRLQLEGLSLRYAFLDDAPVYGDGAPDGRRHGPLSLSVRAGVDGIGYSSIEGLIVLPTLSVAARKHLGSRAFVWADAEAGGGWVTTQPSFTGPYGSTLWPGWPNSRVALTAGGTVQVVDHLAVSAGAGVHQLHACAVPTCAWAARGATAFAGPILRPWPWLSVSASGQLGGRERPFVAVVPDPDGMGPVLPPRDVWWWGVNTFVTFFW